MVTLPPVTKFVSIFAGGSASGDVFTEMIGNADIHVISSRDGEINPEPKGDNR